MGKRAFAFCICPIVTAFRTLTIIPVPGKETDDFPLSIGGFPLVGLFLGGVVSLFYCVVQPWTASMSSLFVLLALATESFLTGALHLDGLGDCADAFPGKSNRERILEILKDSRMGTFGICAIVFDLLFKFVLWSFWFEHGRISPVIISLLLSAAVVTVLWAVYCKGKIGGITGDCLGALNEIVEVTVPLTAAVLSTDVI